MCRIIYSFAFPHLFSTFLWCAHSGFELWIKQAQLWRERRGGHLYHWDFCFLFFPHKNVSGAARFSLPQVTCCRQAADCSTHTPTVPLYCLGGFVIFWVRGWGVFLSQRIGRGSEVSLEVEMLFAGNIGGDVTTRANRSDLFFWRFNQRRRSVTRQWAP